MRTIKEHFRYSVPQEQSNSAGFVAERRPDCGRGKPLHIPVPIGRHQAMWKFNTACVEVLWLDTVFATVSAMSSLLVTVAQ